MTNSQVNNNLWSPTNSTACFRRHYRSRVVVEAAAASHSTRLAQTTAKGTKSKSSWLTLVSARPKETRRSRTKTDPLCRKSPWPRILQRSDPKRKSFSQMDVSAMISNCLTRSSRNLMDLRRHRVWALNRSTLWIVHQNTIINQIQITWTAKCLTTSTLTWTCCWWTCRQKVKTLYHQWATPLTIQHNSWRCWCPWRTFAKMKLLREADTQAVSLTMSSRASPLFQTHRRVCQPNPNHQSRASKKSKNSLVTHSGNTVTVKSFSQSAQVANNCECHLKAKEANPERRLAVWTNPVETSDIAHYYKALYK